MEAKCKLNEELLREEFHDNHKLKERYFEDFCWNISWDLRLHLELKREEFRAEFMSYKSEQITLNPSIP